VLVSDLVITVLVTVIQRVMLANDCVSECASA